MQRRFLMYADETNFRLFLDKYLPWCISRPPATALLLSFVDEDGLELVEALVGFDRIFATRMTGNFKDEDIAYWMSLIANSDNVVLVVRTDDPAWLKNVLRVEQEKLRIG
jgi:hypothetical protein